MAHPTQTGVALLRAQIAAAEATHAYQSHRMCGIKHASSARSDAEIMEVRALRAAMLRAGVVLQEARAAHSMTCAEVA